VWTSVFIIIGEFSPNFELENIISRYRKGFFVGTKMAQIRKFLKKKGSNRHFFNDKFQDVANNIEGCF